MGSPLQGILDRSFHHELLVHGIVAQITIPSDPNGAVTPGLLSTLFVHRGVDGTKITNIFPSPQYPTYEIHFPIIAPSIFTADNGTRISLYVGAISVNFNMLTNTGSVEKVAVFDGSKELDSFSNLGWTGNHPNENLKLPTIKAFSHGLDIVLTLATPIGAYSGFEFRSVGITLVKSTWIVVEPDPPVLVR